MSALDELLPVLEPGEVIQHQPIRVDGDTMTIPLHVFKGDGRSARVEASFSIETADETTMSAALFAAVNEAREQLK